MRRRERIGLEVGSEERLAPSCGKFSYTLAAPPTSLPFQGSCARMDGPSALMAPPAVSCLVGSMAAARCLM